MSEPMRISPKYAVEDWKAVDFSTEEGWKKAICIFEDRIRGRFLDLIDAIKCSTYAGFAVLALDCLLIETLQQFRKGLPATPQGRGEAGKFFESFLTETSFSSYFNNKELASMFYNQIRCGILHQGEVKENSRVLIRKVTPLVSFTADRRGIIINRKLFHKQLVNEFEQYLSQLRDPSNSDLRSKFKKKMDHICRVTIGD
ncbi:MAG: hypothetical protein HYW01_01340 [Deltaproteobacteria bacterium]|nr:hypothetical protein [Deltaproteobacteria bacterium]